MAKKHSLKIAIARVLYDGNKYFLKPYSNIINSKANKTTKKLVTTNNNRNCVNITGVLQFIYTIAFSAVVFIY